jgi:D-alanyl-D-alanine carboxypeptidase
MPDRIGDRPTSLAAQRVYAKTGTGVANDPAGAMTHMVLAGYIQLPNRQWLIFAQFATRHASLAAVADLADKAQQAMAEIATTAYQTLGRNPR